MIIFQVTYTYHYCTLDVYSIEFYNYNSYYPQHPLVMETWISALINEKIQPATMVPVSKLCCTHQNVVKP